MKFTILVFLKFEFYKRQILFSPDSNGNPLVALFAYPKAQLKIALKSRKMVDKKAPSHSLLKK